jgi:hypothetical protein
MVIEFTLLGGWLLGSSLNVPENPLRHVPHWTISDSPTLQAVAMRWSMKTKLFSLFVVTSLSLGAISFGQTSNGTQGKTGDKSSTGTTKPGPGTTIEGSANGPKEGAGTGSNKPDANNPSTTNPNQTNPGASGYAPGRSDNAPSGQGGTPPGQAKKDDSAKSTTDKDKDRDHDKGNYKEGKDKDHDKTSDKDHDKDHDRDHDKTSSKDHDHDRTSDKDHDTKEKPKS